MKPSPPWRAWRLGFSLGLLAGAAVALLEAFGSPPSQVLRPGAAGAFRLPSSEQPSSPGSSPEAVAAGRPERTGPL